MSVRAYRINKIETEQNASFNLWHDTEFMQFLEETDTHRALNEDGVGTIEVSVTLLRKAVENLTLDDYTKESLLGDIVWAKEQGAEYVMYSCG